ncbi:MAG: hypothetical protein GXO32_03995 [Crenarchaeota archaeon]|nr:hypothetical protein [Thermoproteota archaeon]
MRCRPAATSDIITLSSLIEYQFGIDISKELSRLNDIYICFGTTNRMRRVLIKGELLASIRAGDYHLIPYKHLAKILHARIPYPRFRLVLVGEMVRDIVGQNTIFARHVAACDYSCSAGDEVLVVDENDNLLGVAVLKLSCETIISALRGPAAVPRFWCVE